MTPAGYNRAILSGLAKIPEAVQFDEVFGKDNVDHFISHSGTRKAGNVWTSTVNFGGRYELSMQIPVKMGRSFDEVLTVQGSPMFVLMEISEISLENGVSGRMNSSFEKQYGHFDAAKWKKVYEAKGDFSVIGIPLKKDQPVVGFDEYVAASRRDRIRVPR